MNHDQKTKSEIFKIACRVTERECPDDFAKSYARVGIELQDAEAQRVQALYILSNIGSWRGSLANLIREIFQIIGKVPERNRD